MPTPLTADFFARDVLEVAPDLVGKLLIRTLPEGELCFRISETEAYRGEQDTACHAHRGKTRRNAPLYGPPGRLYLYLCYGIHWMANLVTGGEGQPQGVLLRGCLEVSGPGRLTKALSLDGSLNGQDITACPALRIEDDGLRPPLQAGPRIGIGYASAEDQARPWRWWMEAEPSPPSGTGSTTETKKRKRSVNANV
ncbi:MAG: DNA-3-methyladenine glycosylase [Clostridia bacterium]|nr:DNA-3-methyladenine glycosylase [Clostridia bacterium]